MSTGNLIWGVNNVTVSYLIHHDRLLQNATDVITKYDNNFITECCRNLLQIPSGFFLQNATVLLQNVAVIYKLRRFYHKMRQLLQNATFITNYDITQCMKVLNDI